jgi:CelD/BcsL family acetyltransferase involved in cellulose biosynthesis
MARLTVRSADPGSEPGWDDFVRAHPRATPFHLSVYTKVLHRAYRARPVSLVARDDGGRLRGVMPLVYSNGLVSEPRLDALSVAPSAGPLGQTRADEVILLRAARELMVARGARRLTTRSRVEGYERDVPELAVKPAYPSWAMPLPEDPETLRARWKKTSKNVFRSVKKAEAGSLRIREADSTRDLVRFYRIYLATMKRHGSLPRSLREFVLSQRLLGPIGAYRLWLVEQDAELAAGGMFYLVNGTLELIYNASDARFRDARPNHALYWHAMKWAIEHKLTTFDFGIAEPGDSLAIFKQQWGAEEVPIYRYVAGGAAKTERLQSTHGAVQGERPGLVGRAWHATPLPLTAVAGDVIYRWL